MFIYVIFILVVVIVKTYKWDIYKDTWKVTTFICREIDLLLKYVLG